MSVSTQSPIAWLPPDEALRSLLAAANEYAGATSPNPPVAAAALDRQGRIVALAAHERAGAAHAEARLIDLLEQTERERPTLERVHGYAVTLEPCRHQGRTPPCAQALDAFARVRTPQAQRIWIGAHDPNPHVVGGGIAWLREQGWSVSEPAPGDAWATACARLLAPFERSVRLGLPYVTLKQALRRDPQAPTEWTAIPPTGQKTFSSFESLRLAHSLRKRADAILTSVPTLAADRPEFTVRYVADFEHRRAHGAAMPALPRTVILLTRSLTRAQLELDPSLSLGLQRLERAGLVVRLESDLESALRGVVERGGLEVLIEAGPRLSAAARASGFVSEEITIRVDPLAEPDGFGLHRSAPTAFGVPDRIEIRSSTQLGARHV